MIKDQFKKLGYKIGVVKVENINNVINNNKIKILNIDLEYKDPLGLLINIIQFFEKIFRICSSIINE